MNAEVTTYRLVGQDTQEYAIECPRCRRVLRATLANSRAEGGNVRTGAPVACACGFHSDQAEQREEEAPPGGDSMLGVRVLLLLILGVLACWFVYSITEGRRPSASSTSETEVRDRVGRNDELQKLARREGAQLGELVRQISPGLSGATLDAEAATRGDQVYRDSPRLRAAFIEGFVASYARE